MDDVSAPRTYLDHNATAPMRPEVAVACLEAFEAAGNPSSVHAEGRRARALVETARTRVAALVGAAPGDVVFTSGGTEANTTALRPGALLTPDGRPVRRLLVGATEHPSCLMGHGFAAEAVAAVAVDGAGRIDLASLKAQLEACSDPTLVSIQVANSETGVLQPILAIAELAHRHGAACHADAVQAVGRIPVDLAALGLDALTLSAHKLGGPMGAGALVLAPGRAGPSLPLIGGGGQERGFRAGTEAVPAITGFGIACEAAARDLGFEPSRLAGLRNAARDALRRLAPEAVVFGEEADRLRNTLAFAVPGLRADTALMSLDLAGVAVSSGSACSSGRVGRSHVLAAMGVDPADASGAIRVSFGWSSTVDDVAHFARAFETLLQRLYERGRAQAA